MSKVESTEKLTEYHMKLVSQYLLFHFNVVFKVPVSTTLVGETFRDSFTIAIVSLNTD